MHNSYATTIENSDTGLQQPKTCLFFQKNHYIYIMLDFFDFIFTDNTRFAPLFRVHTEKHIKQCIPGSSEPGICCVFWDYSKPNDTERNSRIRKETLCKIKRQNNAEKSYKRTEGKLSLPLLCIGLEFYMGFHMFLPEIECVLE